MDAAGIAAIITAIAALVGAGLSGAALIMGARNGRSIETVRKATNGMADRLAKATGDRRFLEGVTQGEDHPRDHEGRGKL